MIRIAVETGTDGIDLTVYWLPATTDDVLLPLRRLAYRNRVEIYSIGTRIRLAQRTAELREQQLIELRKWLDVAQKLGATHVRVFGGDLPEGATLEQAIGFAVETMKRGAELAGARGLILGLEDDGGITDFAKETIEIVTRTNSPWAGMNLDIGNFRPPDVYRPDREIDPVRSQYPCEDRGDARRWEDGAHRTGTACSECSRRTASEAIWVSSTRRPRSAKHGAGLSPAVERAGRQLSA